MLFCILSTSAYAADLNKGKELFASRCASCHGNAGLADGPVGKAMPPGVITNLVKGPFKHATDKDKLKELIEKGGAALKLNAMMPPTTGVTGDDLDSLAEFVLSLRK